MRSALFVEIGLVFLSFAFILSAFIPVVLDEPYRLVLLLEVNPKHYLDYLSTAFFNIILPSAIGIGLIIVGYMKDNKNLAELTPQWALVVIAGIFLAWGSLYLFFNYGAYQDVIRYTDYSGIEGFDNTVLTIYSSTFLAGGLFILAGLLMLYPPLKTLHHALSGQTKPQITTNV